MPGLLDYLGYIFFGGCIIGPFYEYKEYDDFINLRDEYARMPKCSNIVPAFLKLLQGAAL